MNTNYVVGVLILLFINVAVFMLYQIQIKYTMSFRNL